MLYQLELFKRNAGLKDRNNDGLNKKEKKESSLRGHKIVLGFFDHLKLSEKKNFLEIAKLSDNFMEPGDPYYRYHVAMFDIPYGPMGKIEAAAYKEGRDFVVNGLTGDGSNNIYLIVTLKMNTDIFKYFANIEKMYKHVFRAIGNCLDKNIGRKEPFALFGSPGSIDFVLICAMDLRSAGERFNRLLQLPFHLRRLRMKGPFKHYAYFDFSTTFLTYDARLEFDKIDAAVRCSAHIRCTTLHFRKPAQTIENDLTKHLKAKGFAVKPLPLKVSYSLGSFDYNIAWEGSLAGLLCLCTNNELLSPDNTNFFRSINLTFLDTDGSDAALFDVDETPPNKFPAVDRYLRQLRKLYQDVLYDVPKFVNPTLENLLYTCKYLLFSDYHHNTGKRTYLILKNFLERIAAASGMKGNELGKCIQELAFILPGSMLINSVYLDNLDDLDGTSPVSKMFYAYEHFLRHIYTCFKGRRYRGELELFLTLGRTDQIFSETYLDNNPMARAGNVLASINLPNTASLAPEQAYGFLIHEASHFIILDDNHGPRNRCFIEFYAKYVALQVHNYFKYNEIPSFNNKKRPFNVKKFAKWLAEYLSAYPSAWGEPLNALTMTDLQDMLPQAVRDFALDLGKRGGGAAQVRHSRVGRRRKARDRLYDATLDQNLNVNLYEAVHGVIHNKNHIKNLVKTFNDACADILTLDIAFFEWDAFSDFYLGYFTDNRVAPYADGWWAMRMAAVYIYYLCRDVKLKNPLEAAKIARENLGELTRGDRLISRDRFRFQRSVLEKACEDAALLMPIVEYFLKNAAKRNKRLGDAGIPSCEEIQRWESDRKLLFFADCWMNGIKRINDIDGARAKNAG